MKIDFKITPLTRQFFQSAVDVVMRAELDSREEVEHHLLHLEAHSIAIYNDKVIGVIGWYQDNVHYADKAMGDKFPGVDAYWVGFFAVEKEHQGKGVGTALLNKLEGVVKERNANSLWVSSVPESKSYYESRGFRLILEGQIEGSTKYFLVKNLA